METIHDIPEGFARHDRKSPVTDPWEPLYRRVSGDTVVLTPHHFHEHDAHQGFFHAHFRTKGAEAARACHGTLTSLAQLAGAA